MTQRVRDQSRGFVLMMLMLDHEYTGLLNTGRIPECSRPCVQCSRAHLTRCVVFDRQVRMCGGGESDSSDASLPVNRRVEMTMQYYYNLCEQPGGYHKAHMLVNNQSPGDPVLEPICMPGRSVVKCKESSVMLHAQTGTPRLVIDQSAIVWKPQDVPQPEIGRNMHLFSGGANKHSKVGAQSSNRLSD